MSEICQLVFLPGMIWTLLADYRMTGMEFRTLRTIPSK
jgi:hypothetical protein